MILTDYICPICGNRWGDFDACPHTTIEMLERKDAEIERLNAALDKITYARIDPEEYKWSDMVFKLQAIARAAREAKK